ncbi:MAG: hypothetical protein FK730_07270 [Asgard group archaeon]|nr:hypothetical protein [Asgard group archaeon]
MLKWKNYFTNLLLISILISSPIFITGQLEKDPIPIYMYPVFDVKNDWMIEKVTGTSVIIRNLSDITDLEASKNTYNLMLPLEGTDIISSYLTDCHLMIVSIDTSTYDEIFLEALSCEPVHNPEWQGYCIFDDTKTIHTSSDDFFKKQKFHLQGNYAFLEVLEDSNDYAIEIVNITDVATPVKEAHYKYENNIIFDYEVHEDTMIICIDEAENIRLVDIADKSNPINFDNTFSVPYEHYCYLIVRDNQLYAYSERTIKIFDLTNIPNLELLYELELIEHDQIQKIAFYDHYLIAIKQTIISIFDCDTPTFSLVSEITFDGPGFMGFYYGLVDNEYLYVSLYNTIEDYTLAVYDLTNILNPELVFPNEFSVTSPLPSTVIIITIFLTSVIITCYRKKSKK